MRDGEIWKAILRLRVFTPWMILEELRPPTYMRGYIKEKIRNFLLSQTKNGVLRLLHDNPPVFGLPGETLQKIVKHCPCGKGFIPNQKKDTYCSEQCEREYRKRYLERKRRQAGMKEKRRYTEQEERLIWETLRNGCTIAKLQELSKQLGRHPEAIRSKLKKMKKRWRYLHDGQTNHQADR